MIVNKEIINKVREYFDLNLYEAKVWLALLSEGVASAGKIAEKSGVPRSRTYDVLESLERRGFVIIQLCKPTKYIAVKPTEVIEKMKSHLMNSVQDRINSLSNLKNTQEYSELEQLHSKALTPIKPYELAGSIKGRANIISTIRSILNNSKKEAIICTTLNDFEDKSRVLVPSIRELMRGDIKVKLALSGEPEKILRLNKKLKLNAKTIETRARVFISDKKEVLFLVTPEEAEEEVAIWLSSPFFIESFSTIIENSILNSKENK